VQLIDTMSDVPTVALSTLGTPLAANTLARALLPFMFPEGQPPVNSARYLFLDPGSRDFYPDWDKTAREMVSALRLRAGHDPSDRALSGLVGELATRSTEFRTWWGSHTVRTHSTGSKRINHPILGEMTLGYESLTLPSSPDIRL